MYGFLKKWFAQAPRVVVTYPDGVEPRGFQGKSAYADQANIFAAADSYPHVIFDVGANTGDTTERYHSLFPEAAIYSFEPFPKVFGELTSRHGHRPNVRLFNLAISDQSGPRTFHTFSNPVANSLLAKAADIGQVVAAGDILDTGVIQVDSLTLDDFCRQQKIGKIDILKFDIQGAELKALQGASSLLKNRKVGLIYLEVLFASLYDGQAWFFDVAQFLNGFGYELFDYYNFTYRQDGKLKWGDAIFRPKAQMEAKTVAA